MRILLIINLKKYVKINIKSEKKQNKGKKKIN
jgi:hypothetical protein